MEGDIWSKCVTGLVKDVREYGIVGVLHHAEMLTKDNIKLTKPYIF